jgi:hypothetical protein
VPGVRDGDLPDGRIEEGPEAERSDVEPGL